MPPAWKLQRELGRVYNALGIYRDALAIFQRLELWDGVVSCYQALDQDQRAEDLVRQRLAQEETPDLWCVLGDLKQDTSFYDTAWKLSKGRSSRAMRSKGFMLLRKVRTFAAAWIPGFHDCTRRRTCPWKSYHCGLADPPCALV